MRGKPSGNVSDLRGEVLAKGSDVFALDRLDTTPGHLANVYGNVIIAGP